MSPDLALPTDCIVSDVVTDRRSHPRYPIELDLRYKALRGRRILKEGLGKTRDISTKGLLFRVDQPLPKGATVEVSLDWPLRLDGLCPLQVKITGEVLRNAESGTAIYIRRYEFRTRGELPILCERAHVGA